MDLLKDQTRCRAPRRRGSVRADSAERRQEREGRWKPVARVLEDAREISRESRARELAASIEAAEERARRRIGKGIHDEIGQNLAVAKLKLDALDRLGLDGEAGESLARIHELLDRSVHACRGLTFELASPVLYELGLEAALQDLGQRVEGEHGIRCVVDGSEAPAEPGNELAGALFRIARELVHNVVKHARASLLEIRLETTEREIRVAIDDDGIGFDATSASGAVGGFGLLSARERLGRLGGRLEIDSRPGAGTRVEVVVPRHAGGSAS